MKNILTTERNGRVVASFVVGHSDDIILSSSSGKVIRCNVSGISIVGRATQGVKIISLESGESVVSVTKVSGVDAVDVDEERDMEPETLV